MLIELVGERELCSDVRVALAVDVILGVGTNVTFLDVGRETKLEADILRLED